MIKGKEDITDKEFEEILLPFYNNYNEYLIKFVIPDAVAFYLAKLCNPEENDNFAHDVIKYEKLKNSEYDFFVLEN